MILEDVFLKKLENVIVKVKTNNKEIEIPFRELWNVKFCKVVNYQKNEYGELIYYIEEKDYYKFYGDYSNINLPPITNYYIDEYYGGNIL